jgi:hypothetical protein
MDEHQCTNCGAALPRTGTYCLACDTPVAEAVRGLSVGEIQVVRARRPLIAAVVVGAIVVAVAGLSYGVATIYQRHLNAGVSGAAKKALSIVARAEGGHAGACPYVSTAIAGDPKAEEAACVALVDDDPGARFARLSATAVHRHGRTATAELHGTVVDRTGRRPFSERIDLVEIGGAWMLKWDGRSLRTASRG